MRRTVPMRKHLPAILLALALPVACGDSSADAKTTKSASAAVPERFFLVETPAGAVDVTAAHASVKDGEEVVVRGVVGGSEQPFVAGLAAFTIVDPALKSCEDDGMGCKTPWDYCCVDPTTLAKGSATIELREGEKLLAAAPRGFHGLDHLKTVVVAGTASRDSHGNLTIVARGLHPLP